MTVSSRSLPCALALLAASWSAQAALVTTTPWNGLEVSLISPEDKIFRFDPFDVAFKVDSTGGDVFLATFTSTVTFGDTIDVSSARWSYQYHSDEFVDPLTGSGLLTALPGYRYTAGVGHSISLLDLYGLSIDDSFGSAWLSSFGNDWVQWDFTGIRILDNTDFGVVLDDSVTAPAPFRQAALVIDPPRPGTGTPVPVPEPATLLLAIAGLGAATVAGRRGRRGAEAA